MFAQIYIEYNVIVYTYRLLNHIVYIYFYTNANRLKLWDTIGNPLISSSKQPWKEN